MLAIEYLRLDDSDYKTVVNKYFTQTHARTHARAQVVLFDTNAQHQPEHTAETQLSLTLKQSSSLKRRHLTLRKAEFPNVISGPHKT